MNKKSLVQEIIRKLEADLLVITRAANAARDAATHEDSIARSKYETFGLEASYLAQGQSRRVEEIKNSIVVYSSLPLSENFNCESEIKTSALVTLTDEHGDSKVFFVGPEAGGLNVNYAESLVTIITPQSPVGKAIMGKYQEDTVNIVVAGETREFEIAEVV